MKRIPTQKPSFYVVSMLKEKPPLDASGYKKKTFAYFYYWALCHLTLQGLFSNTVLHAFKTLQVSMA